MLPERTVTAWKTARGKLKNQLENPIRQYLVYIHNPVSIARDPKPAIPEGGYFPKESETGWNLGVSAPNSVDSQVPVVLSVQGADGYERWRLKICVGLFEYRIQKFSPNDSGSITHSPDKNRVAMSIDLPVLVLFANIVAGVASRQDSWVWVGGGLSRVRVV